MTLALCVSIAAYGSVFQLLGIYEYRLHYRNLFLGMQFICLIYRNGVSINIFLCQLNQLCSEQNT